MGKVIFIFLSICLTNGFYALAQTRYYVRVAIVENGSKRTVNDDAHYITFSSTGCYDSDVNGVSTKEGSYTKIQNNQGWHSYSGSGPFGHCSLYFNDDYSRLNVKVDATTYVYALTTPSSSNALVRNSRKPNDNTIYAPGYANTPISPEYQSGNSTSQSTRRTCPNCNGSGYGAEQIVYAPSFTSASDNVYCRECGRVTSRHSHVKSKCSVCRGKGYVGN